MDQLRISETSRIVSARMMRKAFHMRVIKEMTFSVAFDNY